MDAYTAPRRALILALAAALAASAQVSDRALRLHRDALVFDAHLHMINRQFYHGGDIGKRVDDGQVDLVRAREGGLDAMFFTLFVTEQYYPARFETRQTLRLMDLALRQIQQNSAVIGLARTASDVERLNKQGKIAAMLDLEGSFDLDGDLGILRSLHQMGLRVVQLPAHNWANTYAESCCATSAAHGLTEHGRQVVREMNRLGMVINISHASDATIEQVLETSADPVMATHHGLRGFTDIPRTMPEALLKKLAAKGGVMGFHIGCEFHSQKFFDYRTKQAGRAFYDMRAIGKKESEMTIFEIDKIAARSFPSVGISAPDDIRMTLDQWFRVVDRAIEIAGEDHVALGTDFDGGPSPAHGVRDVRDLPLLTQEMLRRGYSEKRVRKFLGENTLRVVRQVTEKRP